jgi:hypothetical protein
MEPRVGHRYNDGMRRLLPVLAGALLALALAPSVLGDEPRDPRCSDWEQHGAPPGIDLRVVCTATQIIGTYTGSGTGDITDEPALPYVVALLVTGAGLAVVGLVAMRFVGGRAGRRLAPAAPDAWWVCPSCQSLNAVGRPACYACHAGAPATRGEGAPVLHRAD